MPYDPAATKYPYPENTAGHYITVKKNDGTVFDKNYPYVDKSEKMRFGKAVMRALLYTIAFPVERIRTGLRVRGRENLKKYKDVLKGGVVSCSNHVHFWDYICVMDAVKPFKTNLLAWDVNVRGENGKLIRLVGGIPVPADNAHGLAAFNRAVKDLLDEGQWLHIYGEGSMWEYYQPIRPFKTGAAYFACACGKPILPLAFSYRKPGFIRRKIFGQIALLDLKIGEPLFADPSLSKEEQKNDLTARAHAAVCRLAGIDPAENIYPPIYNDSKKAVK